MLAELQLLQSCTDYFAKSLLLNLTADGQPKNLVNFQECGNSKETRHLKMLNKCCLISVVIFLSFLYLF